MSTILNFDLSTDAVPDLAPVDDNTETTVRLEACEFGASQSSGKLRFALTYSLPDHPNAQLINEYVSIPTDEEQQSGDPQVMRTCQNKLRNLRRFYENFDIDPAQVDTDEVCARLSAEKPEKVALIRYVPERENESGGDPWPPQNRIKRFL